MAKFVKLHISADDVVYVSMEMVISMTPVKNGTLVRFIMPEFVEENGIIASKPYRITVKESIDEILNMCQ